MKLIHIAFLAAFGGLQVFGADQPSASAPARPSQLESLDFYFTRQVRSLEGRFELEVQSKESWLAKKDEYRRQLAEMLGLDPAPPRTDLHATKTGEFEHEGIVVENLHYQSMPGLYVTANLYRPKVVDKPLPTVLYVCGHKLVAKNNISYGNKVYYEHHGIWYAKHGFVCLTIDTVELGELRGVHHGTYSEGRWWWLARGYTPAGVEAWAGIRGLDYLQTRPDVDKTRFGITGRSGGGAYSWWIAALDDRIKVAAPTAGITDLRNYVLDGCVEHHCDCMFFVNTYRWDFDKVAALIAPRPLCIINTDKDSLFPLDGVMRIYDSTRRVYKLLDAENNLGLQISYGPHADTQALNSGEFAWMTRFLQNAEPMASYDMSTNKNIDMEKLKVFAELPKDERNTKIDETFVPSAPTPIVPATKDEWIAQRQAWMAALREKCFRAWPKTQVSPTEVDRPGIEENGLRISRSYVHCEDLFPLPILLAYRAELTPKDLDHIELNVFDNSQWESFPKMSLPVGSKTGIAFFWPRGVGETAWDEKLPPDADPKTVAAAKNAYTHRLRRLYLIGETLDGQQVWDIRMAIRALQSIEGLKEKDFTISAHGVQAGNALYASLFENHITRLELHELPHSHRDGPIYLNVMKYLDVPQAVAMAAERSRVILHDNDKLAWAFPKAVGEKLGWGNAMNTGVEVRDVEKDRKP
jgi:dienelactone hydrolase